MKELKENFPRPAEITSHSEALKKAFTLLFGRYLKVENILQNYDEFSNLKELQKIDRNNSDELESFRDQHFLTEEEVNAMLTIDVLPEREIQDYRSAYNDIREWLRIQKSERERDNSKTDWDDVVFEIELLKEQEIDLDYILELLFEHNKKTKNKEALIKEMRRIVRSSLDNRAKEGLIVDFINETDLEPIPDKAGVIKAFYEYASEKQQKETELLIAEENLNREAAERYIKMSLKREYASENGTDLNDMLPKMSPLNPQYLTKKQTVLQRISAFVEKFKRIRKMI